MSGSRGTADQSIRLRAYAKLNFYLAVIERRPDGEVTLSCGVADLEGPDNLAMRAAELLRDRHAPGRGVRIALTKRIPLAAGLAGGSSDAAAVLTGLDRLWELNLTQEALRAIALELGSDVPYLLAGGTMSATGRGEALRPLDALRETWFVLLHPPIEVSAARVYNHAALHKSREERIEGITSTFRNVLEAMTRGELPDVLQNAMEAPVFSEFPELAVLKQRLLDAGCAGALMSGSGPTLYGLCKDKAHAEDIAKRFPELPKSVVPSVQMGVEWV